VSCGQIEIAQQLMRQLVRGSPRVLRESDMRVFLKAKGNESYSDRAVVESPQEEIRRLTRDAWQSEADEGGDALKPAAVDGDALKPAAVVLKPAAVDGDALKPEPASSISSGLSIIGKIVGRGALAIFGHVEGEVRASIVVIAEDAQMVGDVVAEELTIGGHLKGNIHANRVRLASTSVVEGDIFHRTLAIVENAQFAGRSCRSENAIDMRSDREVGAAPTIDDQALRPNSSAA
jgi:cytoskeletal protein CcmA (bactofilin family)